ncbi:MAG TPA: DUF819 family protein [Phycisphaerae bacterium]|nr:DUF819 family protein [Phycisphaerae bacterium]
MRDSWSANGTGVVAAIDPPLLREPIAILAVLVATLAAIVWAQDHARLRRLFKVVPAIAFCYFVPTLFSTLGIIPNHSELYRWIKDFILPASLVLLTLSLDVPAIFRLGPRALIMFLAATVGVVLGGPIALALWKGVLPADAWLAMSYLAGTWVGGSANGLAVSRAVHAEALIGPMVIVDIAVGYTWMGLLLYLAGRSERVDRWFRADRSAIDDLQRSMEAFHARVMRNAKVGDWLAVLAVAFGATAVAHGVGQWLAAGPFAALRDYADAFVWKMLIVTGIGMILSFTRVRTLEGVGASSMGNLMLYLLIACIGAGADFAHLRDAGWYLAVGITWMAIHAAVLIVVGRLVRAPFFYFAMGSQANIGGAASAPVVAAAFSPVLAPVGVLLAIAGYALGTIGGYLCVQLCRLVAGG